MKKENKVLIAGSIGFFAVLGLIAVRKFLDRKHKKYNEYYSDFHRHFDKRYRNEEHHGVEFLALK